MSLNWVKPGHNSAAEYQVSGVPYVTSSAATEVGTSTAVRVRFPYVTRWVTVASLDAAAGDNLYVGFTENGVKSNPTANRFVVIAGSTTPRLEVRCKELWFLAAASTTGFSVMAGLTNAKEFPVVSGSNGFVGVG